jgi:hypothetical protein
LLLVVEKTNVPTATNPIEKMAIAIMTSTNRLPLGSNTAKEENGLFRRLP